MELVEGADLARVCEQLSGRKVTEIDDTTWREALTSACAAARSSEVPLSGSERTADRLARARTATEEAVGERSDAITSAVRGPGYVAEVVEIIRQVAEAADTLHEAGIVHRDTKPGNIMVARDGKTPVLMDLGVAQLADETEGRLTRTRQFIGTLRYATRSRYWRPRACTAAATSTAWARPFGSCSRSGRSAGRPMRRQRPN
jgi:hypothetical protein